MSHESNSVRHDENRLGQKFGQMHHGPNAHKDFFWKDFTEHSDEALLTDCVSSHVLNLRVAYAHSILPKQNHTSTSFAVAIFDEQNSLKKI